MKAVVLAEATGPDGLVFVDRPDPQPGPGEVLVRLRAAALNFRDTLILKGGYRSKQKPADLIPLSDGAGEVAAVGPGVDAFKPGDRVTALFYGDWQTGAPDEAAFDSDWGRGRDGMLCELKVFPAHALVPTPATLTDTEAAALPCAALTAWAAVIRHGRCKPGDIVLTQGTGGVSLFALQFAKVAGAEVIITSSSDAKLQRARGLGADHGINYRTIPTWGTEARDIAGWRGIDNVIELGGAETLKQSLIAVKPGGTLSLIGVLSGAKMGDILLPFIVTREVRLQGITVGSSEDMRAMLRAMELHGTRPVIDRVFPMADAAAAFRHLEAGAHFGKVCIEI